MWSSILQITKVWIVVVRKIGEGESHPALGISSGNSLSSLINSNHSTTIIDLTVMVVNIITRPDENLLFISKAPARCVFIKPGWTFGCLLKIFKILDKAFSHKTPIKKVRWNFDAKRINGNLLLRFIWINMKVWVFL